MVSCISFYAIILVLFEIPTILLLTYGLSLTEVTPWFDNLALIESELYGKMYTALLVLLVISRCFAAYLPGHRLIHLYNTLVHTLEFIFFISLVLMRESPVPFVCYLLLLFMIFNCGLFGWKAFRLLAKPDMYISETKKKK